MGQGGSKGSDGRPRSIGGKKDQQQQEGNGAGAASSSGNNSSLRVNWNDTVEKKLYQFGMANELSKDVLSLCNK